jgi:AcrR family transcriptional regulator
MPMSQAQRMTQAERTDLSDSRMLQAAVRLIVERGMDKTTLKDVGEQAGYSRGLAGYRFGSKAGLFEFIVRAIGEVWLQELTRVTENKAGFAAIAAATDEHLRFCQEAPEEVRAFYMLWFDSVGPRSGVKQVVAGIHDRRRRDVAEWIRHGMINGECAPVLSEDAIAGQFSASIVGIVYHWLQHPEDLVEVGALHDNLKRTMAALLGINP